MRLEHFELRYLPSGDWSFHEDRRDRMEGRWHLIPISPAAIDWLNALGFSRLKLQRSMLPISHVTAAGSSLPPFAFRLGRHHNAMPEDRHRISKLVTESFENSYLPSLGHFFGQNGRLDPALAEATPFAC